MKIQVLGTGCTTCETLYKKVLSIAQHIDKNLKVDYITDITKLVELGAMSSPVFAINDNMLAAGYVPNDQEIKDAILERLNS